MLRAAPLKRAAWALAYAVLPEAYSRNFLKMSESNTVSAPGPAHQAREKARVSPGRRRAEGVTRQSDKQRSDKQRRAVKNGGNKGAVARGLEAFALDPLAFHLAGAAHRLGRFPGAPLGGFFVMAAKLHLAEHAFTLKFLFQRLQRLIDVVIPNENLHLAANSLKTLLWATNQKSGAACAGRARNPHRLVSTGFSGKQPAFPGLPFCFSIRPWPR